MNQEEKIRKIAISHQRQMCSVHPTAIIEAIEAAINYYIKEEPGAKVENTSDHADKIEAELRSLKQSILESPLYTFFPKRDMSFHDKVVIAIHSMNCSSPKPVPQNGLTVEEQTRLVEMLSTRYNVDELNEITFLLIKDRNCRVSSLPTPHAENTLHFFESKNNPFYPHSMKWSRGSLIELVNFATQSADSKELLPEFNEVYYHAKALSMDEFREYWEDITKGKKQGGKNG